MCSMYWNFRATGVCPACTAESEWELQTHFMGEVGSCVNYYALDQVIPELEGASGTVATGDDDPLGGYCPKCSAAVDWGFTYGDGKITALVEPRIVLTATNT